MGIVEIVEVGTDCSADSVFIPGSVSSNIKERLPCQFECKPA